MSASLPIRASITPTKNSSTMILKRNIRRIDVENSGTIEVYCCHESEGKLTENYCLFQEIYGRFQQRYPDISLTLPNSSVQNRSALLAREPHPVSGPIKDDDDKGVIMHRKLLGTLVNMCLAYSVLPGSRS